MASNKVRVKKRRKRTFKESIIKKKGELCHLIVNHMKQTSVISALKSKKGLSETTLKHYEEHPEKVEMKLKQLLKSLKQDPSEEHVYSHLDDMLPQGMIKKKKKKLIHPL
mmetsp:Transcript_12740/g.19161  ORF Transcript_12740/g.19161 Transcript_12740/m.19161 type:complete len:110 (+) Transcript_12740:103-432(+)